MRFSSHLYALAESFIRKYFKWEEGSDFITLLEDWRDERKAERETKGGNYISGHLRRRDFLLGRADEVIQLNQDFKFNLI